MWIGFFSWKIYGHYFTMLTDKGSITIPKKGKNKEFNPLTCGSPKPNCSNDQKVYLSLRAYPMVVHQVNDVVNFYFKITNLTDEDIVGPVDFYISGSLKPIASIDDLPAGDYYDLLITGVVDEEDISKKFVVATVWARLRPTGCLLGNVVESEVAIDDVLNVNDNLQFANPSLLINATETSLDVQVGVDIINLTPLEVDSLVIDLSVIFGKDTKLSYLIDGLPSTIFDVVDGVLSLIAGNTIEANHRFSLLVTNDDKSINLDGFGSKSCQSIALWRFAGKSTNSTNLAWAEAAPPVPTLGSGFSAVKEWQEKIPFLTGPIQGWVSQPQGADPLYNGTFNDTNFNESTGVYTVPAGGRYFLAASIPKVKFDIPAEPPDNYGLLQLIVADECATSVVLGHSTPATGTNTMTSCECGVNLFKVMYIPAGAEVSLMLSFEGDVGMYASNPVTPVTFSATYLGP